MSLEERRQILKMVEEGKITAEEAAKLMRVLGEDSAKAEATPSITESGSGVEGSAAFASTFNTIKARVKRYMLISLLVGVFMIVGSAWIIYAMRQNAVASFWFFCMMFPLMLGVLLIVLGAGGRSSRWLYVNVDRRNGKDGPRRIVLGFPLPFGFLMWLLRTFRLKVKDVDQSIIARAVEMVNAMGQSAEPIILDVNDSEDGEHVQVYIG
ncbi:MAG TPA: hypothetical protein VNK49_01450 [Anaerolineales bacterium]|nr:hypothetical protein [Anaerolineales bacterium]